MNMTVDELRKKLKVDDLEEQIKTLKMFIESETNQDVLTRIRIANEAQSLHQYEFKVTNFITE